MPKKGIKTLRSQKVKEVDMFKKKVALRDIAEIEKSEIFVLFENEASYEDYFSIFPQVF